jgi:hypothetical protein
MRGRNYEAARMESDYLARVRSALAGNAPSEIDEIIQSVQEHIEAELSENASGEVSLAEMATVLERLGPPDAYGQGLGEPGEAAAPPVLGKLDFGGCWNDAFDVYKRNVGRLIAIAALVLLLSIGSLLILAGPLTAGAVYAVFLAIRRPTRKVVIGDMFLGLRRFWTLLSLLVVKMIPILIGSAMFVVPGVLLQAIWLYATLLVLDKNEGVFSSLKRSYAVATANGFWVSFAIAGLIMVFQLATRAISHYHYGAAIILRDARTMPHPGIGFVLLLLLLPLSWSLIAAAYNRCVLGEPASPAGLL